MAIDTRQSFPGQMTRSSHAYLSAPAQIDSDVNMTPGGFTIIFTHYSGAATSTIHIQLVHYLVFFAV